MKRAEKKQIDSNKNLKQTNTFNKNSSTSKINAYFKPAIKSFDVEAETKEEHSDGHKQFYIQILKEKLQTINGSDGGDASPTDGACSDDRIEKEMDNAQSPGVKCCECEDKRKECTACIAWEQQYKDLKKLYLQLTVNFSELDMKHKNLLKRVTDKHDLNNGSSTAVSTAGSAAVSTAGSAAVSTADSTTVLTASTVENKTDIFTPGVQKFLDSIGLEKSKDSTFVLQCLHYLYKSNPNVLATKSLFGTKDSIKFTKDGEQVHCPGKQPITPTKAIRIKQLFVDRISKCDINSVEYGERMKEAYVHKLLASGIKNMSK